MLSFNLVPLLRFEVDVGFVLWVSMCHAVGVVV